MADLAELTRMIEPAVEAEGLALVRVRMIGGASDPTLQIMAEDPATRQLTLDDCARLSRRLSELLDALEGDGADPIDGAYRLEVSSPGIDRPLTRLQDFQDWQGHQARMVLVDPVLERKQLTGLLLGVERELIGIQIPAQGEMWVTLANIQSAKLVMTDALIAATAPLSSDGADTIKVEGQDS